MNDLNDLSAEIKPNKRKFLHAVEKIDLEPAELRPCGFMATFLIQCTLPHSDPGNVPIWKRVNNQYTLAIQPGYDFHADKPLGIPYGTLPRLLLIWMVTEAKRTKSRQLELGSLTNFLKTLKLDPRSRRKKRSDAARLVEGMRRLFGARIIFHRTIESQRWDGEKIYPVTGEEVKETQVTSSRHLLWEMRENSEEISECWIELGADFYAAIMKSTVPCNMDAVNALRKSPLAIDLYMLLNWIGANLVDRNRKHHFLKWQWLGEQLGCGYGKGNLAKDEKKKLQARANLKKKIKKEMVKVALVHKKLKWKYDDKRGGIIVYPSSPAISKRLP